MKRLVHVVYLRETVVTVTAVGRMQHRAVRFFLFDDVTHPVVGCDNPLTEGIEGLDQAIVIVIDIVDWVGVGIDDFYEIIGRIKLGSGSLSAGTATI